MVLVETRMAKDNAGPIAAPAKPGLGSRHAPHTQPGDFPMTARRAALAAGAAVLELVTASVTARAQWIVFDPTNFSQNVLTAARELR
jgi:hypothetical protein